MANAARKSNEDAELRILGELEKKVLWLSSWTIHHANHIRENDDGLKVGGHQASSASLAAIMTALYFHVLRPQDRVAVKPHASPNFHAIQYLLGKQTRGKLEAFRGYKGAQSYPSRTKDSDDVDFSTGSVGLGVAQTLFSSLVQDYVRAHFKSDKPEGRFIALVGDAEMDEGNIFEAMLEGWKQGLRNCWWVIDYNRQSLDAVIREGLWARYEALFKAFGWDVVIVKHGELQEAAFKEPGGEALRNWINNCPNQLYSALTFQGGAAWRKRLMNDIGDQGAVSKLLDKRSDDELARLMGNLGGHDLPSLIEAFDAAAKHDRPTCFICYTIKGSGLALAGHKDNHAGMMTPAQMEALRVSMGIRAGHEWNKFEGLATSANELQAFLDRVPFATKENRRYQAPRIEVPRELSVAIQPTMSTQFGFGALLNELGRGDSDFVKRIVTTSPDVTVSTNLGPWVNRRNLFAREKMADTFKSERIASTFNWEFTPTGQHIELGIAENNLFIALSALGLSHSINGERLFPIGTLYDPFIARGLDALNYACYQEARFILVATPSGITLAGEGGAHQSIGTPLIGMAQDGLAAFEPAYVDELAAIMAWSFDYIQKDGEGAASERNWLRDETGGSVYLRLSTRPIEQIKRSITPELRQAIIDGAYWMRKPGPNCQVVVAYTGAVAPEAIEAIGLMGEDRRDVGLLAVTSADRLNAGWTAAQRARERGLVRARSHIERLMADVPPHCGIVTVCDAHPATLGWLGAIHGHRTRGLGVEHFGQTGSIPELYRHYGIDANAIVAAAEAIAPGRPIRYLKALP
ncbi:MAG TPA: transketolase [Xanthobacteraceae bacterium]|nr:transketolase [Xanthobacteraceae bacterium]